MVVPPARVLAATPALVAGAPLPSPEPEQKAVPLDVFPASLLANLRIAKSAGYGWLTLDTALNNSLGQRFYFRWGMLSTALHFGKSLR